MVWGILRVSIFGVAFLTGMAFAGFWNPVVNAATASSESAELSPATDTSLVVSCDGGSPTVEEITGADGAIQVKCKRSNMHVARTKPAAPRHFKAAPVTPIAALLRLAGSAGHQE
jgi:hypothetical protein